MKETIALHQNESYWVLDDATARAYAATDARTFSTYPDYSDLKKALSKYARVPDNCLTVTAGSDAAIRTLAELYARDRRRVVLPVPTFYGYERIFKQVGLAYTPVCYQEQGGEFVLSVKKVIRALRSADAVVLCQPNNPLGSLIPDNDMKTILDDAKRMRKVVIVDEAYFEFSGKTTLARFSCQPLIILRTLSKAFGLAGSRIGYLLAAPSFIQRFESNALPWPIAHPTVHAALAGLARASALKARVRAVIRERGRFVEQLRRIPSVIVYPSATNFVLVRVPRAGDVCKFLEARGILIACGGTMTSIPEARSLLNNTLRIAVPSPAHRARVLATLAAAVEK